MNLVKIAIANFKQYVEPIEIEIPPQAAIGVIGANGVGKTTLFQAIEWCLYNPASIAAKDIRPRGRTGNPKVTITLESRDGTKRWEVERELKRASTSAAIYEIDGDGTTKKIVEGTKDVTRYVESRLIDLGHRAFVATFFTRQKELHFFGDLSDTDRRREVGKLLGLETIRNAQRAIGTERTEATNHARFSRSQYENAIKDRDLPAEIDAGTRAVAESATAIGAAKTHAEQAVKDTDTSREHVRKQYDLRDRHVAVKAEQDQAQRDLSSTNEQLARRERDIARFADLRAHREALVPVAAAFDAHEAAVKEANALRERHQKRAEAQRRLDRLVANRRSGLAAIRRDVAAISGESQPAEWRWDDADDIDPGAGIARLQRVADARPIDAAARRVAAYSEARRAVIQYRDAEAHLRKCCDRLEHLERQMDDATRAGTPEDDLKRIDDETAMLAQQESAWTAERRGLDADRQRYQRVLDNLEASDFDSGCPTCGRPFSDDDASAAADLFRKEIERLRTRMQDGDRASTGLRQRQEALSRERIAAEERRRNLEQVRAALVKGRGITDEQELTTTRAEADLAAILQNAGLKTPPAEQDLLHAEQAEKLARAIGGTLDRLRLHLSAIEDATAEITTTETEIAAFGEIAYDADAHERAIKARDDAQKAQISIQGFDRELSQEPAVIEDRDRLASRISELEQAHAEAKQRLFDVGFDPEMLQAAETAFGLAEQREKAAQHAIHQAELRHQRAESDLAAVQKEHEALRATLETADRLQREADDLKQMYDEFANFEKWVVARLTPTLGDLTSRIVAQVTDGRYDEVSFDENFGILVRDGDEAPFPVAQFSGGERDVIALAARLALSQLIGAQAAEQPGFLVLDEVFGSLDRDRRTRLLELLGSLGEVSDRFQQVFIISHVDDVRSAPVLDDLWMVRETSPGISAISSLSPGTDIGEL